MEGGMEKLGLLQLLIACWFMNQGSVITCWLYESPNDSYYVPILTSHLQLTLGPP